MVGGHRANVTEKTLRVGFDEAHRACHGGHGGHGGHGRHGGWYIIWLVNHNIYHIMVSILLGYPQHII